MLRELIKKSRLQRPQRIDKSSFVPSTAGTKHVHITLRPTNVAFVGGYLEDQFPLERPPCQVPALVGRSELGPAIECIFYCLLHFESLVKCKMYPKSTPCATLLVGKPSPQKRGEKGHLAGGPR